MRRINSDSSNISSVNLQIKVAMEIKVLFFGQLTDITGSTALTLPLTPDTDQLLKLLTKKFPALEGTKFVLAVNKKQVTANTLIDSSSSIVLMSPFSGG